MRFVKSARSCLAVAFLLGAGLGIGFAGETDQENASKKSPFGAVLGMLLGIAGGFVDNVGVCLQKLSHRRHSHESIPYFKQRLWILGISLYLVGNVMNIVGLSLAPQSQFAILGSLGLVTNVVNSHLILHEEVNKKIIGGTATIVCGSTFAIVFGRSSGKSEGLRLNDLGARFLRPGFLVYMIILVFSLVSLRMGIRILERDVMASRQSSIERIDNVEEDSIKFSHDNELELVALDANVLHESLVNSEQQMTESLTESNINLTRRNLKNAIVRRIRRSPQRILSFAYPFFAGAVGSFTQILAKSASELVKAAAVQGYSSFHKAQTYLLIAGALCLGVYQIHWINMSLKRFEALLVVPVFAVTLETFNIVGGGIFFKELDQFSTLQAVIFPISIMISYAGVTLITLGKSSRIDFNMLPPDTEFGVEVETAYDPQAPSLSDTRPEEEGNRSKIPDVDEDHISYAVEVDTEPKPSLY